MALSAGLLFSVLSIILLPSNFISDTEPYGIVIHNIP